MIRRYRDTPWHTLGDLRARNALSDDEIVATRPYPDDFEVRRLWDSTLRLDEPPGRTSARHEDAKRSGV
jgi:hypothetical protein